MQRHKNLEKSSIKNINQLRIFGAFLRPYRAQISMGILALILTAAMNLVLPYYIGQIFDNISGQAIAMSPRYFYAAGLVAAIMAVGIFMRVYFVQTVAHAVIRDIRQAVFENMTSLSRGFFDRIRSGEIVSRISTDATVVGTVFTNQISMAARHILTFSGGLIMMLITSPVLTGVVLLIVPLIFLPVALLSRKLVRMSRAAQDALAEATAISTEAFQAITTVQSYAQEGVINQNYMKENQAHFLAHKKRILYFALMLTFMIPIMLMAIVWVLWVGSAEVKSGNMTTGTLVQFLFYASMVGGAVQSFSDIWGELLRAIGSGERLAELLKAQTTVPQGHETLDMTRSAPLIEFQDVSFAYPSQPDQMVLRDISFVFHSGESLALVGPSGSGKSTLLQLMLRHYDVDEGRLLIRGQNVRDLRFAGFRDQFAYVSQEPAIFALSIADNIRFSRPGATDEEVRIAAQAAYADEFICHLPDGYDSYVGERGVLLSGGQKARLALARAFLSDAPILLLDEATAALDAESEHFVQLAVEKLQKERSVIAIAHRLATVQNADQIIVLNEGRINARGTHDELLKQSGLYSRLAERQFLSVGEV